MNDAVIGSTEACRKRGHGLREVVSGDETGIGPEEACADCSTLYRAALKVGEPEDQADALVRWARMRTPDEIAEALLVWAFPGYETPKDND